MMRIKTFQNECYTYMQEQRLVGVGIGAGKSVVDLAWGCVFGFLGFFGGDVL